MRTLLRRIAYVLQRRDREAELREEMAFHRAMTERDLEASGVPSPRAAQTANRALGSVALAEDRARDVWLWPWLQDALQDVRYGLRAVRRDRATALLTIVTLGIGIGAATVIFGVAYHVLVDPFPYRDADRLVTVAMANPTNVGGWRGRTFFTFAEYEAYRGASHAFDDVVAAQVRSVRYRIGPSTRVLEATFVSANAFRFLGVAPLLGRALVPEDGRLGAPLVFVLNYRAWQRDFGADPTVIGAAFTINDQPAILVGIMPARFNAFGRDAWIPAQSRTLVVDGVASPASGELAGTWALTGRLKAGIDVAAASADLDRVAHAFVRSNPEAAPLMPETFVVSVRPLLDSTLGAFRTTLYGLTLGVLLLLGIATVNVANLLLARATAREREMAMRTALGASRGRIVRQLLIEGLMLATVALTFGWGSAYWGLKAVIVLIPAGSIPQEAEIRLNTPVLAISLAVAAAVTVLCGLAPALHLLAVDVNRQLASRSKGSARTVRHSRLRSALVVTEIAMAVVLLAATGGLLRSFMALTGVDLGFDPGHVVYVRPWFPEKGYTADKQNAFTRQLLDRMHAMPGVSAAAESMLVPPLTYDWSDTIIPGRPHTERWETKIELCSEGYSQLFALPLMRGRWFSASEVLAKRLMVVVNDAFVRRYFPDQDPIGHRVKFQVLDRPFLDAPHDAYFEIVGVVGNYKLWADTWRAEPQAFLPYSVQGFSYRTFLARTSVDPATVIRQMTKQVWAIDPAVGVWASGSIEHSLSDFYSPPRFELATFMAFAAIGIGLALVGIFAVMTYAVSRRTNELAVRLAIGARHVDVLRLMLRDGVRLVLAGIAGGIALSYALDAVVRHRVSSVRPPDTGTALVVCVSVALVGIAACVIPTYRVLKIDVGAVLRED